MSTLPLPIPWSRIMVAPMAGGPSTPRLVASAGNSGALGFIAAGYKSVAQLAEDISSVRAQCDKPFGVNLFTPVPEKPDQVALVPDYIERLRERAQSIGVSLGTPVHGDDNFYQKVDLLLAQRPALVSFTFGLPERTVIERFHEQMIPILATVTSPSEASRASLMGVDGVVLQGWEAGAHRGGLDDTDEDAQLGLLPLLRLVRREVELPLIAAGGIGDGAAIAAVLVAGATAAMLGTAFLRCIEAGTSRVHADALGKPGATVVTRAYTGRSARAIRNNFTDSYSHMAPAAYPEIHYVTSPLRAAARQSGDVDNFNLWAGQAYELARECSVEERISELVKEVRQARQSVVWPSGD